MLYSNQNIRISRWYDLSKNVRNINNEESNIKKELNSELEKAITLNNRSDAKIAISLSGGLDSNTLLSFYKNSDTLKNIPQCYSVFFEKFLVEKNLIKLTEKYFNLNSNFTQFYKKILSKILMN